jgi:hypothetical protein
MKKLLALALVAIMACGAMAQEMDEFGLWTMVDGEYVTGHSFPLFTPSQLFVTLHNTSVATVGGYEVSFGLPADISVTGVDFPNSGLNFGDADNHLVGYGVPLPAEDLLVLATVNFLLLADLDETPVEMAGANPPSIPGWDGPVIADGANPDILIECGYITGSAHVFTFQGTGPVAVEASTLSGVKALFE